MPIYIANLETGSVRHLIGESKSPLKANYWDDQAVWWRGVDPGNWDY